MNERIGNERDPAELERDIDRTRASLGRTVDELEQRLSPGQLLDHALRTAREQGGDFAANLGRAVKNNPVPMLLTSVGLAWMMASSKEPRAGAARPGESAAARVRGAGDSLASRARSAGASVGEAAQEAGESMSAAADTARERLRAGVHEARSGFERMMEEQPLVVGALGIALGAALGAALPRTEQEDRMLGEASDRAREEAYARARSAGAGGAREEAGQAGEIPPAMQEAGREQGGDTRWEEARPGTEH